MHVSSAALTNASLIAGYVVFLGSYLVFALGKFPGMKIDRPGAAIIGAVLMFAFRIVQPGDAARFIDYGTLVLLFSMMLIVANLHLVGFFDAVAEVAIERLGARHLLPAVIFTSGVLSAFFVNDIICLVMVPFVLHMTRRMGLPPLAYLLAVATGSNIGSWPASPAIRRTCSSARSQGFITRCSSPIWAQSLWSDCSWTGQSCTGCSHMRSMLPR